MSKMGWTDETLSIATTHPDRKWITSLLPALRAMPSASGRLLDLSPCDYKTLFQLARTQAALDKANPHQLRHGGASMDGMTKLGDLDLADRGRWAALGSIRRYRRPAHYIKRLRALSLAQRTQAKGAVSKIRVQLPRMLKQKD